MLSGPMLSRLSFSYSDSFLLGFSLHAFSVLHYYLSLFFPAWSMYAHPNRLLHINWRLQHYVLNDDSGKASRLLSLVEHHPLVKACNSYLQNE